jgi:dimeric dUTPase (all-alpha-NTP-PPase superfamily)
MNTITQMFNMQKHFNDATNGECWVDGQTKEGRKTNWHRCIYMEAVEAIDSFNWKHWKDLQAPHDWNNARVELVDIWHFIMSEAIATGAVSYAEKYLEVVKSEKNSKALIKNLEQIIYLTVTPDKPRQETITLLIDVFFSALTNSGMGTAELYKHYLVKNQLNTFRQNNGYKDGSYKKLWDGVEDNVVAFSIMDTNPETTPEALYALLEKTYQTL